MVLFEQKHCFSATFISIIIIVILASACVIDDGNTHSENDNRRAESTIWNDGIDHLVNDSRHDSGNKDGDIKHERTVISQNGNREHDESSSRHYNGNILRDDGYFAGKSQGGNVIGELDATPSYAELFKDHKTEANRYSNKPTTEDNYNKRTPPFRVTLEDDCMYSAYYCLKAYKTGPVCGRTLYFSYQDFKNYCMLDYVNCMEKYESNDSIIVFFPTNDEKELRRYFHEKYKGVNNILSPMLIGLPPIRESKCADVWQIVHMGECMNITRAKDYEYHEYYDESFLDQIYVYED